jgi:hypothetical protein
MAELTDNFRTPAISANNLDLKVSQLSNPSTGQRLRRLREGLLNLHFIPA